MNILRLVFFAGTHPVGEHFLTTFLPEPLAPAVEALYRDLRPELPGVQQRLTEEDGAVYLDVRGPIYGGGDVNIHLARGYRVRVPVSHVDAVVAVLREAQPREAGGESFLLLPGMFHIGVIYAEDREEVLSKLTAHVEGAAIQRTLMRAQFGEGVAPYPAVG